METSELKNIISDQNIHIRSQSQWADSSIGSTQTLAQREKIKGK